MDQVTLSQLIPDFDPVSFFRDPWDSPQTLALALVIAGLCSLLGSLLILRRQALAADAISHSVLPGIVVAYLVFHTMHPMVMLGGAALAGLSCVWLIAYLQRRSRMHADAATGVAFTSFFALGMLLIGLFGDRAHLDMDGVLYGHLELAATWTLVQTPLGEWPQALVTMALLAIFLVALLWAFYRQWLLTSFDAEFATTLGVRSHFWHGLLMALTSMVVVAALEAVGAVLVVGMMALPAATARLVTIRLPGQLLGAVLFSVLGTLLGLHVSLWMNISLAPCMAVSSGLLFLLIWTGQLGLKRWQWQKI
jgi:manganese/zinc/iron transport system permease protein